MIEAEPLVDVETIHVGGLGAVLAARHGHVLLITLNRPEARNAINAAVTTGVGEALDYAEESPDIWAVIVTGAGEKAFCAGADLKEMAQNRTTGVDLDERRERWGFAGFVKHAISKPIIVAVNGFALGGGTEIVLFSDLAIAAEDAQFGLPEVKWGIFPGAGGVFRLSRLMAPKLAMEMILTGQTMSAARALELGMINRVVPRGRLIEAAFELAATICENAPLSVQASKRLARGIVDGRVVSEESDWVRADAEFQALLASEDASEGLAAFAQKRAARWRAK